jgi:hypothetical protein
MVIPSEEVSINERSELSALDLSDADNADPKGVDVPIHNKQSTPIPYKMDFLYMSRLLFDKQIHNFPMSSDTKVLVLYRIYA